MMDDTEREDLHSLIRVLRAVIFAQKTYIEFVHDRPYDPSLRWARFTTEQLAVTALLMSKHFSDLEADTPSEYA